MEIELIETKYSKIAEKPGEYFKGVIVLRRKSLMLLYLHVISRRTVAETYVIIEIYLSYKYTHEYQIYIDTFYFFCTESLKSRVHLILAPQYGPATL